MKNLVLELKAAVRRERECTALVLRLLKQVEAKQLYLEMGYSTLFAFCQGELGYSEPETSLRMQALRLVKLVPEVEKKLEAGEITLTVASQVAVAARRERLEPEQARGLVEELAGSSKREAEKKLAEKFPEATPREKVREVNVERVEIRFTVTREEMEVLQKLMDRKAHTNFERKWESLFLQLARGELKKYEGKQGEDALLSSPDEEIAQKRTASRYHTRTLPAKLKRHIWKRDQGRCQYQDPSSGRRCLTSHALQIDHIKPFAQGGPNMPENLRLLCGAHNRFRNSG